MRTSIHQLLLVFQTRITATNKQLPKFLMILGGTNPVHWLKILLNSEIETVQDEFKRARQKPSDQKVYIKKWKIILEYKLWLSAIFISKCKHYLKEIYTVYRNIAIFKIFLNFNPFSLEFEFKNLINLTQFCKI